MNELRTKLKASIAEGFSDETLARVNEQTRDRPRTRRQVFAGIRECAAFWRECARALTAAGKRDEAAKAEENARRFEARYKRTGRAR